MGKLKEWAVKWFLGGVVRDIAEGKRGPALKKAYWAAAGWKTRTSAILALVFLAFSTWHPEVIAQYGPQITFVVGLLVTAGLADADWKKAVPPAEWAEILHEVMAFGASVSGFIFLAQQVLDRIPGCAWCPKASGELEWYAGAVAGVCTWLAARFAPPPEGMARRASDPQPVEAGA